MKKLSALFLALIIVASALTCVFAAPADVYVSPDGEDLADGSLSAPFKTLQKAIDAAEEGATVYLRGGTYDNGAVVKKSVKIKAYDNEKVVFSAAQTGTPQELTKEEKELIWESDGKKKAVLLSGIERVGEVRADGISHALISDGKFEYPASLLDDTVMNIISSDEVVDKKQTDPYNKEAFVEKKQLENGLAEYTFHMNSKRFFSLINEFFFTEKVEAAEGMCVVGFLDDDWFSVPQIFDLENDCFKITANDSDKKTFTTMIWFLYHPGFINKPGEWGAIGDKVFCYVRSSTKTVEYLADYTTFITGEDAGSIEISGIEFSKTLGNAVKLKNCPGSVIKNCTFTNIADTAIVLDACDNSRVSNCSFTENASGCVSVSSSGCVVDNCGFENSAVIYKDEVVVELNGNNNTVSSCEVSHCSSEAVYMNGKNNTVTKSRISNAGEFAAESVINITEESSGNKVEYNIISDSSRNCLVKKADVFAGTDYLGMGYYMTWKSTTYYNPNEKASVEDLRKGISVLPIAGVGVNGTDNLVSNNIFSDISYGVEPNLSTGTTVSGNVFSTDYTYVNVLGIYNDDTREFDYPQNCVIKSNFICDQDEINGIDFAKYENSVSGNVPVARQVILGRDDSLVFDVAQQKIPDFKNIDSETIGRYEPEDEPEMLPQTDNKVALLIGSDKVSADGAVSTLDASARIVNDRTLVPVRFISEAFGKTVDWDEQTRTVTIDKAIQITIGESSIIKNGAKQPLDTPADIYDSRTFVPLRAIAEALDKYVLWDNRGLIVITDSEVLMSETEITDYINLLK